MPDESKNPLILLAEDELHFRQIYKDALTSIYDYRVIEAKNGQEAIYKTKKQKPDLILLDLILPKKDGFDVIRHLKNNKDLKDIPIIIYSVLAARDDIDRALKLGANDYAIKGTTPAIEVVEKIKNLLTSR